MKTAFTLLPVLCASVLSLSAATTNFISQFGITWGFSSNHTYGQFANGDYWVVGPVTITNITPACVATNGRTVNGSMINPSASNDLTQGYDSAMYAQYGPAYSSSLNVGQNISAQNPLVVPAHSSLISSVALPAAGARPQLKTVAILTVLAQPAAAGSFRPPYAGTNKTILWNTKDLDYSRLRSLPRVPNTPSLSTVAARFERPWLDHYVGVMGQYFHPQDNMPSYGTEMAQQLASGLLVLQLDYTTAEKSTLVIRMVQIGIDFFGIAKGGAVYFANGGHNLGRKMPLILAGLLLGDTNILAYGDAAKHFVFQEDQQTWVVQQSDVGRPLYHGDGRLRVEYIQEDVGIPEWGNQHVSQPSQPEYDGRNWDVAYRQVVGSSLCTHALVARLMNVQGLWNREVFFDYTDRYWRNERNVSDHAWDFSPFEQAMMEAYWSGSLKPAPMQNLGSKP